MNWISDNQQRARKRKENSFAISISKIRVRKSPTIKFSVFMLHEDALCIYYKHDRPNRKRLLRLLSVCSFLQHSSTYKSLKHTHTRKFLSTVRRHCIDYADQVTTTSLNDRKASNRKIRFQQNQFRCFVIWLNSVAAHKSHVWILCDLVGIVDAMHSYY